MDLLQQVQRLGVSLAGQALTPCTQSAGVVAISGSALQNAGQGFLFLRAYNEDGRLANLGHGLSDAFTGKPSVAWLLPAVNLASATFTREGANRSTRITGFIKPPGSGVYSFRLTGCDGGRLFIDGSKVIDAWTGGTTVTVAQSALYANTWYSLTVEHCTVSSTENLLVEWSLNGTTFTTLAHATDGSNFRLAFDGSENPGSHAGALRVAGQTLLADSLLVASPDRSLVPGSVAYAGTVTGLQTDLAATYTLSIWLTYTASAAV
jgi:hypothetical protein